jgi:hypothetical protein
MVFRILPLFCHSGQRAGIQELYFKKLDTGLRRYDSNVSFLVIARSPWGDEAISY